MRRDVIMPASQFSSSFLSCEKDIEEILRKLFISSKPYSDYLKKLLGKVNYVLSVDTANVEMMGYKKWLIDKIKFTEKQNIF